MFLNPSFKMTTYFANIARPTARTSKLGNQESFQIVSNTKTYFSVTNFIKESTRKLTIKVLFNDLVD